MNDTVQKKSNELLILGIVIGILVVINLILVGAGALKLDSDGLSTMLAAALTIAIFSFLYKDNPLYKLVEHLYVGAAAAYSFHMIWYDVLSREVVQTLVIPTAGTPRNYWIIIPTLLGALMLGRLSRKTETLSRISFAFLVGFFAGQAIPNNIAAWIIEQIGPTIMPLYVNGAFNFNAMVILTGVISVLVYFFFSIEHKGVIGGVSKVGIYFLMISFGASFGYTVMARISLLIGRVSFIFKDWIPLIQ